MANRKPPPELTALIPLVKGLQATLGRQAEVVLHDFRNPDRSVIAIAGQVTGRQVGAPLTDRLLAHYRKHGDAAPDILNVRTRTPDGRLLRSSTIFIRNGKGQIIGSLGINLDLTEHELAARLFADYLGNGPAVSVEPIHFATDVKDVMQRLIESALAQMTRAPQFLSREERLSLVRALDAQGLFLIRGAVEEVARRLGVSRFTVYGYLDEIRRKAGVSEEEPPVDLPTRPGSQ